ncbi:MAG: alanine racemase [Lachnospiraceae bacterium]|nr:alanine racemase [Lachnospiraceae bacterium]
MKEEYDFYYAVNYPIIKKRYLRTYAEIDLNAALHNIKEIRHRVGDSVKIMAVIKADGYGHGAVEYGKLYDDYVDYFGVATIDEGIELREAGLNKPILILGYTSPKQYADIAKYNIEPTIYTVDAALKLSDTAVKYDKTIKFHIAVDTGMTRIGFQVCDESIDAVEQISKLPGIRINGMFTHFACADEYDKTYTMRQMELYDSFYERLEEKGIDIPIKHVCNSAGIMEFDHHRFDMVRAGIVIYGLYPSEEVDKTSLDLRPVMSLKSHVVNVFTARPGVGVSYGATFTTGEATRIATVSIGYADGYPRALSNKGRVLIKGHSVPIVGRVCMDQMMVDITGYDDIEVEDIVILVGRDGNEFISVEEVSALAGSFNYEFVCDLSKRVPRVYVKNTN